MINAGSCKPQLTKGIVNAVGWCVENRIIYAQEAIINCSCDTLNWLKNQIGFFKKEAQLNSIWDEIENNDGVYLVPKVTFIEPVSKQCWAYSAACESPITPQIGTS